MALDVTVSGGRLRGHLDDGVPCFLGVPYARDTAGPGRFRPPLPPEPWMGIKEAVERGPIAPQPPPSPGISVPGDPTFQSEDCLHLNVWTPEPSGSRPVMVFIHGGSFISGTGGGLVYRGRWLAEAGDVVVVTISYRLGALGFMAHSSLVGDGGQVGNWGLMDQLAALRWIRENIAKFGGDPANVTLFGESAGAMGICALMAIPAAAGLFHKAIVESGPPFAHRRDRALAVGDRLVEGLNIESSRHALEELPAAELVAAVSELQLGPVEPGEIALPLLPTIDGVFLPRDPADAIAEGSSAEVALLAGTNRDEMTMFSLGDPSLAGIDEVGLARWIDQAMPGCDAAGIVTAYVATRSSRGEPVDPPALWQAIAGDVIFRYPTLQLVTSHARVQPSTYLYLFTQATPVFGGILGSCHALELPFVFGTLRNETVGLFVGTRPEAIALSDQMIDAWSSFAHSGSPSAAVAWEPFEPISRATMVLGPGGGLRGHPRADELEVLSDAHPRSVQHGGVAQRQRQGA